MSSAAQIAGLRARRLANLRDAQNTPIQPLLGGDGIAPPSAQSSLTAAADAVTSQFSDESGRNGINAIRNATRRHTHQTGTQTDAFSTVAYRVPMGTDGFNPTHLIEGEYVFMDRILSGFDSRMYPGHEQVASLIPVSHENCRRGKDHAVANTLVRLARANDRDEFVRELDAYPSVLPITVGDSGEVFEVVRDLTTLGGIWTAATLSNLLSPGLGSRGDSLEERATRAVDEYMEFYPPNPPLSAQTLQRLVRDLAIMTQLAQTPPWNVLWTCTAKYRSAPVGFVDTVSAPESTPGLGFRSATVGVNIAGNPRQVLCAWAPAGQEIEGQASRTWATSNPAGTKAYYVLKREQPQGPLMWYPTMECTLSPPGYIMSRDYWCPGYSFSDPSAVTEDDRALEPDVYCDEPIAVHVATVLKGGTGPTVHQCRKFAFSIPDLSERPTYIPPDLPSRTCVAQGLQHNGRGRTDVRIHPGHL